MKKLLYMLALCATLTSQIDAIIISGRLGALVPNSNKTTAEDPSQFITTNTKSVCFKKVICKPNNEKWYHCLQRDPIGRTIDCLTTEEIDRCIIIVETLNRNGNKYNEKIHLCRGDAQALHGYLKRIEIPKTLKIIYKIHGAQTRQK